VLYPSLLDVAGPCRLEGILITVGGPHRYFLAAVDEPRAPTSG
jgi:hypothetical protein